MSEAPPVEKVICNICHKSYKNSQTVASHKYSYHRKTKVSKPMKKDLLNLPTKQENTRDSPEEKNYLAQYLKERNNYFDQKDFNKYKEKMTARDKRKRDNPNEAGPSSNGKLFPCYICYIEFPTKEAREDHLDAKHPVCEYCNDRFVNHDQANTHYETFHQNEIQNSQCPEPECNQSFQTSQELSRHVHSKHRKHQDLPLAKISKQDGYTCELCHGSFKSAVEILRHNKRRHPHKCDQCQLAFTAKRDMEKHKIHDHSESSLLQIKGNEDSSQDTDDYDKAVTLRSKNEMAVESNDSENTLDNDKKVVPRKRGDVVSNFQNHPQPTLVDYYSSDESVESIDEEPLAIENRPERSGVSQLALEDTTSPEVDMALAIRESSSDESRGLQLALEERPQETESQEVDMELAIKDSSSDESRDSQLALDDRAHGTESRALDMALAIRESSSDESQSLSLQDSQDVDMPLIIEDISSEEFDDLEETHRVNTGESTVIPLSVYEESSNTDATVNEQPMPRIEFDESSVASSSSDEHDSDSNKNSQVVRCPKCKQRFLRWDYMYEHLKTEHKPSSDSEISLVSDHKKDTSSDTDSDVSEIRSSQLVKCQICYKKFATKDIRADHIKTAHASNKHHVTKCVFCEERPAKMAEHIKSEHSFACQVCRMRFKTKSLLVEHMTIDHPTCEKCDKSFLAKSELMKHQFKDHPQEDSSSDESESGDQGESADDEEDPRVKDNKDYLKHINCVTVKRFSRIRELISRNDFTTLSNDKDLLEALGIIMRGVKQGYIPICGAQRLTLNKRQKALLYRLAANPSGRLVRREKRDLSLMFDVLWKSVKFVSESFNEYIN